MESPQQQHPSADSELLKPQYDPESQAEREDEDADRERRRWEEDRPPHYEAR
jgi:hypothetical protein